MWANVVALKKLDEEEERKFEELLVAPRSQRQSRSTSCEPKMRRNVKLKRRAHVVKNARPIFVCEDLTVVWN